MSTYIMRANKGVMSVTANLPLSCLGTTAPILSISEATTSAAGSMSATDKTKLNSITVGAADTLDGYHAASFSLTSHAHSGTYANASHEHRYINYGDAGIAVQTTGIIKISGTLPEYLGNATAKSGGLVNGEIYRTGDYLKIVHS